MPVKAPHSNTHTFFYREPQTIQGFGERVLAPLLERRQSILIWCAGCATGEEAYTLAITGLETQATLQILATDINEEALAHARRGVYGPEIRRHVEDNRLKRWFDPCPEGYQIKAEVRSRIHFLRHDLTADPPPTLPGQGARAPRWDAIFCRNVLLYLTVPAKNRISNTFIQSLAPRGVLFIGCAERLSADQLEVAQPGLEIDFLDTNLVYRRREERRVSSPGAHSSVPRQTKASPPLAGDHTVRRPAGRLAEGSPEKASVDALREEGDSHLNEGKLQLALVCYTSAIQRYPLLPDLHFRAALCHLHLLQEDHTMASLRRCLFLNPSIWPAALLLAEQLVQTNRQAAMRYYTQALRGIQSAAQIDLPGEYLEGGALAPFFTGREAAANAILKRLSALAEGGVH